MDLEVWNEDGGVLLELLWGAWQERKGPVMYRDGMLYAEEPGCVGSLQGLMTT